VRPRGEIEGAQPLLWATTMPIFWTSRKRERKREVTASTKVQEQESRNGNLGTPLAAQCPNNEGKKIFELQNEGKSAASFCCQVAAWFPDMQLLFGEISQKC
jgi:hypothetical protein